MSLRFSEVPELDDLASKGYFWLTLLSEGDLISLLMFYGDVLEDEMGRMAVLVARFNVVCLIF